MPRHPNPRRHYRYPRPVRLVLAMARRLPTPGRFPALVLAMVLILAMVLEMVAGGDRR